MIGYTAERIRFENGERHSVLRGPNGLPAHEVTLYLGTFRTKGRAANTIHFACGSIGVLYNSLRSERIDLIQRLCQGEFLTAPELARIATAAQYWVQDGDEEEVSKPSSAINVRTISARRSRSDTEVLKRVIDVQARASRLRYIASFLSYISSYVGATLPRVQRDELRAETLHALGGFREHIPRITKRAKLGARVGLSMEEQDRVLVVVHPESPTNPWVRGFTRRRNWLIVVLLLAIGIRRSELLGLQLRDIHADQPKIDIIRRADAPEDARLSQPNTKTSDRTLEVSPSIMRVLLAYVKERREIKLARRHPQLIVSDEGDALSQKSIDKIFRQIRAACPDLSVKITSHVMRHTWNERFSEQADAIGLSEIAEQRARNCQQGWSDNSKTAATYTRRHTDRKAQQLSLKIQEDLERKINGKR